MYFLEKFKKVSIYTRLNILFQGLNFLFFLIILRFFSIGEVGIITYNESFVILLSTFLVFGLDNYLTRYFLKFKKHQQKVVLGSIIIIATILSLVAELVYFQANWFLGSDNVGNFFFNIPVQILLLSSFVSAILQIQYSLVRIQNDLKGYVYNNILQFVVKYVIILGYCICTVFDVNSYFSGVLIFNIISLLYSGYFISKQVRFLFRAQSIKRILSFSTPLMVNNLMSTGVVFIERVLVKTFFGTNILGLFGFASKFSNAILSFHAALKVEYVPAIVKLHIANGVNKWNKIRGLSRQNIKRLFFVSLAIALLGSGVYFFTMPISTAGFFILAALIIQAFLNAIPLYCYPNLFLRGKTILYFRSQILLVIIYLPLLALLIYLFDYYGFFVSLVTRSLLYLMIVYLIIGKQKIK